MTPGRNPCVWSRPVIEQLAVIIPQLGLGHVHDPFAGEGVRLQGLCARLGLLFTGTDLVAWEGAHPSVVVGDATTPGSYPSGDGWAVVTSPTYNNGCNDPYAGDKSKRYTYTVAARTVLGETNTGRWSGRHSVAGEARYWVLHDQAVAHWPDSVVVNVKDSVRAGTVYPLGDKWCTLLEAHGYRLRSRTWVPCGGNRHGANHRLRVNDEQIIVATRSIPHTNKEVSQ